MQCIYMYVYVYIYIYIHIFMHVRLVWLLWFQHGRTKTSYWRFKYYGNVLQTSQKTFQHNFSMWKRLSNVWRDTCITFCKRHRNVLACFSMWKRLSNALAWCCKRNVNGFGMIRKYTSFLLSYFLGSFSEGLWYPKWSNWC